MGSPPIFDVRAAEEIAERQERLAHMAKTLVEWTQTHPAGSLSEAEREVWGAYFKELAGSVGPKSAPSDVERLVRKGYRMVLFYRNPDLVNASTHLPSTEEEFDALPSALDELDRRRRNV